LFGYLFLFVLPYLNWGLQTSFFISPYSILAVLYCEGFVLYPDLFILYFTEYERCSSSGCLKDQ
jgi:hypothetical protein